MNPSCQPSLTCALLLIAICFAAEGGTTELKTESFDRDPNWEGFNNRVTPRKIPTVTQDFGFRMSNFAGQEKGEIGGQVWRSSTRASYAARIPPKTLQPEADRFRQLRRDGDFRVERGVLRLV